MEETSIPVGKITLETIAKDLKPTIEKQESEDEKIAVLSGNEAWEALKLRIQRKMKVIDESAKVTSNTIGLIDDVQMFGFKCMAKDLLLEAYQGVIDDVELTAKFLTEAKKENAEGEPTIEGTEGGI